MRNETLSPYVSGYQAIKRALTRFCEQIYTDEAAGFYRVLETNQFNRPVGLRDCGTAESALDQALGFALTGRRCAVITRSARPGSCAVPLTTITRRRQPLVVHMICNPNSEDHLAYHSLSEIGVLQAFATDAQHAADLALVARLLSEQVLLPVVVAMDSESAAIPVRVALPDRAELADLLAGPGTLTHNAGPGQRFLFGEQRPTLPHWFDPSTPVALGWSCDGPEEAAARAGEHFFFDDEARDLLHRTMDQVSGTTGRPLDMIRTHDLQNASYALVTQGELFQQAVALSRYLKKAEGIQLGVLAIVWSRPFPTGLVHQALSGVKAISILERSNGRNPLRHEIQRAVGSEKRLLSVHCRPGGQCLTAAQMMSIYQNMTTGAYASDHLWPGVAGLNSQSRFPKREAANNELARNWPHLERVPEESVLDLRPAGTRTLVLCADRHFDPDWLNRLGARLAERAGPQLVCGRAMLGDSWQAWTLSAGPEPMEWCGDPAQAETLILCGNHPPTFSGLGRFKPERILLVPTRGEELQPLPAAWTEASVPVYVFRGNLGTLIELAPDFPQTAEFEPLALPQAGDAMPVPHFLTQYQAGHRYHNLPRFWGEVLQPRAAGEEPVPEPDRSLNLLPAGSAAFPRLSGPISIPILQPQSCSGCAYCWTVCPDSALGISVLAPEVVVRDAVERHATAENRELLGKLKRGSGRIAAELSRNLLAQESRKLEAELLDTSLNRLLEFNKLKEEEKPEWQAAFSPAREALLNLPVAVTPDLFHHFENQARGTGRWLVISTNANACKSCGLCNRVCPENALPSAPPKAPGLWQEWEQMPDTSGADVEMLIDFKGFAAGLASTRACGQAITGGDLMPAGSAARLAVRQICGNAEYVYQQTMLIYLELLEEKAAALRSALRNLLADALPLTDLNAIEGALATLPGHRSDLTQLTAAFERKGVAGSLDARRACKLAELAQQLEQNLNLWLKGPDGAGRSRFGLVLATSILGDMSRFPYNPFPVPVLAAANGIPAAAGIIQGQMADFLDSINLLRHADRALSEGPLAAENDRSWAATSFADLTQEERILCPGLLLITGEDHLNESGFLLELLCRDLPIKIFFLDEQQRLFKRPDLALQATIQGRTPVISGSIAWPDQLSADVNRALTSAGPALIQIHVPASHPGRIAAELTLDRARAAVNCGRVMLYSFFPDGSGFVGSGLQIFQSNLPDEFVPEDLNPWLAGEKLSLSAEELARITREINQQRYLLQELSGHRGPNLEKARNLALAGAAAEYETRLAQVQARHLHEIKELEDKHRQEMTIRLSKRLLDLAGFTRKSNEKAGV